MTTVAVVTPWRNHPELADNYWQAVEAASPDEVLIIDDASTPPLDGAAVRFDRPVGFSRACNAGLHAATADAVVFLNNDVAMTDPRWLDTILADIRPGVLAGRMRYDQHTQVDGDTIPYLDGWCLAGMRQDFLDLGGFDESLSEPAYYSDNLLCLAARRAGMALVDVPVGLIHIGNRTAHDDVDQAYAAVEENRARYAQAVRTTLTPA